MTKGPASAFTIAALMAPAFRPLPLLLPFLSRNDLDQNAEFGFTGMTHRAAAALGTRFVRWRRKTSSWILNFPIRRKVTWWFDHHQSAFSNAGPTAEQFKKHPGAHMFYQPDYKILPPS